MKINLARLEHAELLSTFLSRVNDDTYPYQELFSAKVLAERMRSRELAVVIASHDQSLLGCALGFVRPWNDSLEIGPVSTGNIKTRAKIRKALFQAVRRYGIKEFGLVYFRAATKKEFRRSKKLGAQCWGYRPAPAASRIDDAELIMGFLHDREDNRRVEPPPNSITRTPFAARIIRSFENAEQGVAHPKNYPVGCPQGTGAPMISGRVWPTYHSQGNFINIESAAGAYPVEIIREFKNKAEQKGVRDLRLTLPINQEDAFYELLDSGFRPVAYLPGWFVRGVHRFDCLQMICGGPSIPRRPDSFMENAVARIDAELTVE